MVFPVILLATFMVLFFALYIAQGALVYYVASVAGERTAYNWSNSARELRTGAYPVGSYDGLYWRLLDDGLLQSVFGLGGEGTAVGGDSSDAGTSGGGGLTERKLRAASSAWDSALVGEMTYENKMLIRRVRTNADSASVPEPLRRFRGTSLVSARTSAVVVEPAEFIRSFDLARYYVVKMKGAKEGEASYRSKAKAVLQRRVSAGG